MSHSNNIYIDVHQPFILESVDSFWMVTSGEVNVFYTEIDRDGEYRYALKHLITVKKGEFLFSLLSQDNNSKVRLIGYAENTILRTINKNNILNIDHLFLKAMISKWILKTANALQLKNSPRIYTSLNNFSKIALNENEAAFSTSHITWATLIKGSAAFYGESKVVSDKEDITFPIPVCNKLWLRSLEDKTELSIKSTREIFEDEINFMLSLSELEKHFYNQLIIRLHQIEEEECNHIQFKEENENRLLTATLDRIKNVVGKSANISANWNASPSEISNETPLIKACKAIGSVAGFKIEAPKNAESNQSNSVINELTLIAKSSNIRVRKIILRGNWWKEQNGHLLAFKKEGGMPVALLQSATEYTVDEPDSHKKTLVNAAIAETLEPIGYMFFPGFDRKMESIKDVLGFALKEVKKDAKFLAIAALAGSLIGLLIPVLSGIMFDDIIPTADRSLHFDIFAIMLIIALITAGLQLTQSILQIRVETKSSINLQAGVMDHILRLPVTFYNKYTAGDLTNRVLSINAIRQILSSTLITAALSGAFSFVNLGLLFYYDSKLAWIGVLLGVVAASFVTLIGVFKLKYDRQISQKQGEIQGFLFEFLSGISKIRIVGGEKRVFSLWAHKFSNLKRLSFVSGTYQNFVETFNGSYPLITSMVFFSIIYYTMEGSDPATRTLISVGAFMAFITAFNKFLNDSLRLSMAFITSLNVVPLYERVKPILEADTESTEHSSDPGELCGEIEMNSVSFRYNEDQPLILKDISFKINPGEMVAFVGPSGSGKSTIMRLLLGFEIPELGSIYYDGNSYDTMNKELVRRQIGVVLQNGSLMSGSIFQNIIGNSELSLDDAWEAARMAGMEEDIKQMPMEMHTVVSEGAGTFSGGQRQRLMIARAIVHRPRLLFMDEATSALDNRTQNIVSESLDKLQATRIVIAHRLSTIKNADRIYVMDKGEIVECGTYEELLEKNGIFSELAKRQIA